MKRTISAGWGCVKCGSRRFRTLIVDRDAATPVATRAFQTKCPGCGHPELVYAFNAGECVVSVQYNL